ncbi:MULTISPECIES: amino acid adenylation domain-containing protein [unclassified Mucilaginibacter]|uniref:non-ribosomal peptide synthetase n=1 Tax=unclassified Mucilaginibacter TaxID=2617802 RepID=UPI002AC8BFAF|nr:MULTISPECIES: amino acid adenylation domain-containing protein [unclassified Mucilaginibacter]MEB0260688.1 amino acid adenylation domain-containing protein [Mucilaginibacter sp. 10I4]MEB0277427.1 amino acid adenylation domain-containing protein [Mucilaginibacter sp. 10B2]MEB0300948.1 amino acid adenylation domain-containing protein [Mucilaginibacter sp. 5C4]WPX24943.1 amino acid adenylation domain-containing protein [Mucilaginibacter sp. 5C4]
MTSLNNTTVNYPKEVSLFDLINESTKTYPNNIAITFHDRSLTYSQVNQTANRIAKILMNKQVKKGDVVGLALDRCPEMIIALIAILKTGAAYLPLDPEYPKDRIEFMLEDSGAKKLITSLKYKGHFASHTEEILIEDALLVSADYPPIQPDVAVTGDDLAYILYTSGSTGKPKGVQIAHHSMVNLMLSLQKAPGISPADKVMATATVCFDIAGLDIYLPLSVGAEIVLIDSIMAKDGRALLDVVREKKVTMFQATPYTWRMMLEMGWEEKLPLKILCGGEALTKDLAAKLLPRSYQLWNMYGPTETTIWSTLKLITNDSEITIGKPVANTSVYILSETLGIVPDGEIGEIVIGGDGVAVGYLNRPELNTEKFVSNPFSGIQGDKMYRTGDLGKIISDGEIQCLGRIDHQVKIRGYRIELEEIEHALGKQPCVKQAVVIAREDLPGDPRLAAYIVLAAEGGETLDFKSLTEQWQRELLAALPEYMVPDDFVEMETMPSTPNGKIDRKALPKPDYRHINRTEAYFAPRTTNEKLVVDIWEELMGLTKISIFDNFFELGGRSLVAVRIMARLEQETGKRLPLATLFEHATVEKLAARLEINAAAITWDSLVPIKPKGSKMPLYIVHGAGLNVLLFNALASHMDTEQPIFGLQAKGINGIDEPLDVMEDIARNYVNEIINRDAAGPYALAGYSLGGIIAYEMARQLIDMGKDVKMLAMFDASTDYTKKDPELHRKVVGTLWHVLKQVAYTAVLFVGDPKRTIEYKSGEIKKRALKVYNKLFKTAPAIKTNFAIYGNEIDEKSDSALRNYKLMPINVGIELFRAKKKTFYMEDFKYLGWKPYALKGINVHDIPGEHNSIFAPPNDKEFAEVLQKCLNNAR